MALFKPYMGNRTSLDAVEKHAGHVYLCVDDGSFHLDYVDSDGNLQRKQINADEANKLVGYDIATVLNSSNAEIPTSKAVLGALENIGWNDLKDRPLVMESATITYDGSIDGYVASNPSGFYKVSDLVLTNENVIGQSVSVCNNGAVQTFTITEDHIRTFGNSNAFAIGEYVICVAEDNTILDDSVTFPEKGVYFIKYGNLYVSSLTAVNVARVFDEKYIPSTVARKEDIVQSDWSESNELSSSYVKNKTHYFYNGATVVDGCAFTVSTEGDYVRLSAYVTLVEGKKYRVVIDDATDICEAVHVYDAVAAKNYIELVSNIPEFESITSNLSGSIMSKIYGVSLGDHIISIYEDNELKQLDEMFIPDTIAKTADLARVATTGSWNDLTDRPFYKKSGEYITIIEEQTVTNGSTVTGEALRTGKTYIMTVNGVDYTCKSSYLIESGTTYISISDPYVMVESKNGLTVKTSEDSVTLSVKTQGEDTIVTIPDEYLPSTLVKSIDGVLPNSSGMVRLLESKSFYIDRDYTGTSMRDILNELSAETYRCKGYVYNDLQENSNAYQGLVIYADTYGGADYTHRFILLNRLGGLKVFLVDTDAETINIHGGIGALEIQSDSASISDVNAAIAANKPKLATVSLPAANWTGDAEPYSQVVTINGVTANSKVDLQLNAMQIVELQSADIMLMIENNDGVTTAYAIGGRPTEDYTMQALITEVMLV